MCACACVCVCCCALLTLSALSPGRSGRGGGAHRERVPKHLRKARLPVQLAAIKRSMHTPVGVPDPHARQTALPHTEYYDVRDAVLLVQPLNISAQGGGGAPGWWGAVLQELASGGCTLLVQAQCARLCAMAEYPCHPCCGCGSGPHQMGSSGAWLAIPAAAVARNIHQHSHSRQPSCYPRVLPLLPRHRLLIPCGHARDGLPAAPPVLLLPPPAAACIG